MSKEFRRTEHSDILMHWTGYDIDKDDEEMQCLENVSWRRFCLRPIDRPSLIDHWGIAERYLQRVRDILRFGLWMVEEKPAGKAVLSTSISEHDGRFQDTSIARACFTELKLSEARKHAYEFGRLGFGVKRTYLFRRAGLPMVYVGPQRADPPKHPNPEYPNWISGPLSENDEGCSYLKFMSEVEDLSFKYYSESEWRIVCPLCCGRKNEAVEKVMQKINGLIVDANENLSEVVEKYGNDTSEDDLKKFLDEHKEEGPRYLLPLDFELAVIVYPSPKIKILSEQDPEIRELIRRTRYHRWKEESKWNTKKYYQKMACYKKCLACRRPTKQLFDDLTKALCGTGERMMLPMEIDLDTISHF